MTVSGLTEGQGGAAVRLCVLSARPRAARVILYIVVLVCWPVAVRVAYLSDFSLKIVFSLGWSVGM